MTLTSTPGSGLPIELGTGSGFMVLEVTRWSISVPPRPSQIGFPVSAVQPSRVSAPSASPPEV